MFVSTVRSNEKLIREYFQMRREEDTGQKRIELWDATPVIALRFIKFLDFGSRHCLASIRNI